jgi:hypothetical protein
MIVDIIMTVAQATLLLAAIVFISAWFGMLPFEAEVDGNCLLGFMFLITSLLIRRESQGMEGDR